MFPIFILSLFAVGFAVDDVIEQCSCQRAYIFCNELFRQPQLVVPHPENIIRIYINKGYLPSLTFLKDFQNLQFLHLDKVIISCDLVQTASVPVTGTDCPGKFYLHYFI